MLCIQAEASVKRDIPLSLSCRVIKGTIFQNRCENSDLAIVYCNSTFDIQNRSDSTTDNIKYSIQKVHCRAS